jgi:hypothetical protein
MSSSKQERTNEQKKHLIKWSSVAHTVCRSVCIKDVTWTVERSNERTNEHVSPWINKNIRCAATKVLKKNDAEKIVVPPDNFDRDSRYQREKNEVFWLCLVRKCISIGWSFFNCERARKIIPSRFVDFRPVLLLFLILIKLGNATLHCIESLWLHVFLGFF